MLRILRLWAIVWIFGANVLIYGVCYVARRDPITLTRLWSANKIIMYIFHCLTKGGRIYGIWNVLVYWLRLYSHQLKRLSICIWRKKNNIEVEKNRPLYHLRYKFDICPFYHWCTTIGISVSRIEWSTVPNAFDNSNATATVRQWGLEGKRPLVTRILS